MSNVFSFTGALGRDAELKNVSGQSLLNFAVANSIGFGDKKVTMWIDCSLWGKRGESVAQYLKKGQSVFVSGELSTREYQAKDGSGMKTALSLNVNTIDLVGKRDAPAQQAQPAPVQTYAPHPQQNPYDAHRQAVAQHNAQQSPPPYDSDIPF